MNDRKEIDLSTVSFPYSEPTDENRFTFEDDLYRNLVKPLMKDDYSVCSEAYRYGALKHQGDAAMSMFHRGGNFMLLGYKPKPECPMARGILYAMLSSFYPSHEEKQFGCALALHFWFDRLTDEQIEEFRLELEADKAAEENKTNGIRIKQVDTKVRARKKKRSFRIKKRASCQEAVL